MNNLNGIITSSTEGRIRIRSSSLKSTSSKQLFEALKDVDGIRSLKFNATTGSLLVSFDPKSFSSFKFEQEFNKCVEEISETDISKEKSSTPEAAKKTDFSKIRVYKMMRKVENQTMAFAGSLCLLGVGLKLWKLHSWAGWVFSAAAIAHSVRYKKQLMR